MKSNTHKNQGWILLIFIGLLGAGSVFAGEKDDHVLTVAGGVASPSKTTALEENPAGLTYNTSPELLGFVSSESNNFNPLEYGLNYFTGNGMVGGALGLKRSSADSTSINFGLAADLLSKNFSLGFAGSYTFGSGGHSSGWNGNLGAILFPQADLRFGVTAYHVIGGVNTLGFGVAYDANSSATLALDAAYGTSTQGLTLKPGAMIRLSDLQLSAGYGIVASNGGAYFTEGFSAGLGFNISRSAHLEAYYSQIQKFFFGVSFHI
jgi:hypothetical protein